MSHKISIVEIKNYKSIVNAELKLSSFTPLVGYNNAGKSNCLSAIQWILKKSSLSDKDFFDTSQPVEVIATINGGLNKTGIFGKLKLILQRLYSSPIV